MLYELPTEEPLESVAVFELSVVLTDTYDKYILHVWYLSIDIRFAL
jgi:hypothetical protein